MFINEKLIDELYAFCEKENKNKKTMKSHLESLIDTKDIFSESNQVIREFLRFFNINSEKFNRLYRNSSPVFLDEEHSAIVFHLVTLQF